METLAIRLKKALSLRDLKQSDLVKMTGINKGALSSYIAGRYIPKQTNIYLLAKALNVTEPWLMGSDVPMEQQSSHSSFSIPVLGRVKAGIPANAIQEILDYEEITEELAKSGEFFGLKIKGDSMEPRICEGDVVIVRKQEDAESGDLVIAMVNGDEATCKRLFKYTDGIQLISTNSKYDPLIYSNREINDKPVKIIGRVIECRQKY